jgi:hypothetical protein
MHQPCGEVRANPRRPGFATKKRENPPIALPRDGGYGLWLLAEWDNAERAIVDHVF